MTPDESPPQLPTVFIRVSETEDQVLNSFCRVSTVRELGPVHPVETLPEVAVACERLRHMESQLRIRSIRLSLHIRKDLRVHAVVAVPQLQRTCQILTVIGRSLLRIGVAVHPASFRHRAAFVDDSEKGLFQDADKIPMVDRVFCAAIGSS